MNEEARFSELYSIIEETASLIESSTESSTELRDQFEEDLEEYKTLLKKRYEESIEDESEEGSFYYYNGCHGGLKVECLPYEDIPQSVEDFVIKKETSVSFIIHKKTPVFTMVDTGAFTTLASVAFKVDENEFQKYLKIEYLPEGEVLKVNIYVYRGDEEILIKGNEGVPNIGLEYNSNDFNMGYFPLLQSSSDLFFVPKTKFTDGGFFQGSYVFPKLVADFKYSIEKKNNNFFYSSLFSMEESLLERCFNDLLNYFNKKENKRSEEFSGPRTPIIINLFNSSCLFCSREVSEDIIRLYPQWSKAMAKEIYIYKADNPLLRQRERRRLSLSPIKTIKKKAGSKKKKKKKSRRSLKGNKRKTKKKKSKRSSKNKRKRTKRK